MPASDLPLSLPPSPPPAAGDHDWWGEHKIYIGDGAPPGDGRAYSDHMASSRFCLAIMGDGWSSRFEDSMVHG